MILIWLVQLIIYPSFHRIAPEEFTSYHKWYAKRIAAVVLPLMIAELCLAVWWLLTDNYSTGSVVSIFIVLVIWISTFVIQVPIHGQLKTGKDELLIQRLLVTNWIRTAAWSLKAGAVTIHTIRSI